jgi:hypothetical protein
MQTKAKLPGKPLKATGAKAPGKPLKGPAGPRPVGAPAPQKGINRNPYGNAVAQPGRSRKKIRFLMFGIPYLSFHGLLYGLFMVLGFIALGISGGRTDTMLGLAATIGVIFVVVSVPLLTYSIAAATLAIKGKVAGVWMGLVHVGLFTLLGVYGLIKNLSDASAGVTVVQIILVVIYVALLVLGWLDLRRHWARKSGKEQAIVQSMPQPQLGAAGGSPMPSPAPAPKRPPLPKAPGKAPAVRAPAPAAPASSTDAPVDALFSTLRIAAGLESDHTDERIQRARTVAIKMLGDGKQAKVMSELAEPELSGDPAGDAAALAESLSGHAKLAGAALKAAAFTLKEEQGYTPEGKQFLQALKAGLQQNGVAV